ncbi:MAG: transposase [Bacteroidaceae bacterium]|nr:transposase [Bacteroidaceae bacterium]
MPEEKARYIDGVGWRCDTDTTRHHRENQWDYKGRAIYHITLATADRQPVFGALTGNSEEEAFIVYSSLGEYVDKTFRGLPDFYKQRGVRIRILAVRVMPDHLHGVIHVMEPMPKSIGEVIRSFKSACTSWFKREYFGKNTEEKQKPLQAPHRLSEAPHNQTNALHNQAELKQKLEAQLVHFCRIFATRPSIWEHIPAGYHERILHCEGQLDRMIRYVKDNPRRLWLKHHNPNLFKLRNDLSWSFQDEREVRHVWKFRALGNMFLLDYPQKQHIQCSRSITTDQLEQQYKEWSNNAQLGVVSITSAISDGEKSVSRRLREARMPLIVMLKDGFPAVGTPNERYFKPGGVYFNACAAGRLLLIEPYSEVLDDPIIAEAVHRKSPMASRESMRYHFLALNKVGEMICCKGMEYF